MGRHGLIIGLKSTSSMNHPTGIGLPSITLTMVDVGVSEVSPFSLRRSRTRAATCPKSNSMPRIAAQDTGERRVVERAIDRFPK